MLRTAPSALLQIAFAKLNPRSTPSTLGLFGLRPASD
jgi:hypothetical protein